MGYSVIGNETTGWFEKPEGGLRTLGYRVSLEKVHVRVGKDQEKAQSKKDSQSKNRGGKKSG